MTTQLPTEMKRLVVTDPGKGSSFSDCTLTIETVPMPKPASGEILVKVAAAPINPSDYGSWHRGNTSDYPMCIGKEGCGTVVAVGGGLFAYFSFPVGTRVGFIIPNDKTQGSYSEYVVLNALENAFAMPDDEDLPVEDCASFFVNPYTAVGILDTAMKYSGSKTIVHTAAASQLGQMLNKLAPVEGMEIINVVRREEQAELLRGIGAKHIVVTNKDESEWKEELKSKVNELGATCAFDAVAGSMTGSLMDVMPSRGTVYVYGGLAGPVSGINGIDLIYRGKNLKGFLLTSWIREGGFLQMIPRIRSASKIVNAGLKSGGWSSSQFQDTTMEKAFDDIAGLVGSSATGKKLRIRFNN